MSDLVQLRTRAKILYLTLASYQHGNKEYAFRLVRSARPRATVGFSKRILKKLKEPTKDRCDFTNSNSRLLPADLHTSSSKELSYSSSSANPFCQDVGVNTDSHLGASQKKLVTMMKELISGLQAELSGRN